MIVIINWSLFFTTKVEYLEKVLSQNLVVQAHFEYLLIMHVS